jgi:hypothetical protein
MAATYHLGTSGWSYPGWKGRFYPPDLPTSDWLPFYARHFGTVEINMTFYRYPKPETLRVWMERTPPGLQLHPQSQPADHPSQEAPQRQERGAQKLAGLLKP